MIQTILSFSALNGAAAMFTLEDRLFSIVTNRGGRVVPVIPGLDYDVERPLELKFGHIKKLKYSEDFITSVSELLTKHPDTFHGEIEYDVFPLMISWFSPGATSGCLILSNVHEACQSITYLTSAASPVDDGSANLFDGMSGISDLQGFVDRYPMRPLSVTAFFPDDEAAFVAQLSTHARPELDDNDNELLSAARLSFAAAFFVRSK
jgi:hypothetical protein